MKTFIMLTVLASTPTQKTAPCAPGEKEMEGLCWRVAFEVRVKPGKAMTCPIGYRTYGVGPWLTCYTPVPAPMAVMR
jgi:hypothetical protein